MSTKNLIAKTTFQINIGDSLGAPVKLKDLILSKIGQAFDPASVAVKIILEKNVSIEIIDDIINFDALSKLSHHVVEHYIEFDLHESSKLFYTCKLKPSFNQEHNQANLHELGDISSHLTKRLILNFCGSGASAKVRIRSLSVSSQFFKFQTLQNHLHGDTFSCLCIKNVLIDNAKVECDNLIKVHKSACKSFANQVNRNLIIGESAHVISQPQLEIENDDVKCKHGTATKVIDEEQLFYLQNRGIDLVLAKQLLVKGFLS